MKFRKVLLLLILILFSCNIKVKAVQPLYEIELYEITVDPRKDGTLDLKINMDCVVLNEPLNVIAIKTNNKYVDEIKPISNNIVDIQYKSKMFKGTFIEICLDKAYDVNEKVNITFSYHQSRMYMLNGKYCDYVFSPSSYEDILIKKAVVKWNKQNVFSANTIKEDESYYIWEKPLNYGETIRIILRYSNDTFIGLDPKMEYTDSNFQINKFLLLILGVALFIGVGLVSIFLVRKMIDPYRDNRGFTTYCGDTNLPQYNRRSAKIRGIGRNGRNPRYPSGGASAGHVSHSKGFSCACACAGGGMGRAGCSKKDFYKTNLKINRL